MQVFEYLLAHQTETHEHADTTRLSSAASRAAKRAATVSQASEANRRSGKSFSSKKQKRGPHHDGNSDTSAQPTSSYGFVGMLMALFAGSGFILRTVSLSSKQQSSCRSGVKDRSIRSALCKMTRNGLEPIAPERTENDDDNFMWFFVVATIGATSSSQLPRSASRVCRQLSSHLLKLLLLAATAIHFLRSAIVAAKSWAKNQVSSITERQQKISRQESDSSGMKPFLLNAECVKSMPLTPAGTKKPINLKGSKTEDKIASQPGKKHKNSATASKKLPKLVPNNPSETAQKPPLFPPSNGQQTNCTFEGEAKITCSPLESEISGVEERLLLRNACSVQESRNKANPYLILSMNSDIPDQDQEQSGPEVASDITRVQKTVDAPLSPSSVANSSAESSEEFLSDDKVFDDFYWRRMDEEEEGEGIWIETSAQQTRTRTRKAQAPPRISTMSLRQRQYPLQQQHGRKLAEGCSSSSSKDRRPDSFQSSRKPPITRKSPICSNFSSPPTSTSAAYGTLTAPHAQREEGTLPLTAMTSLKSSLAKKSSTRGYEATNVQSPLAVTSEFPPLPNTHEGCYQSQSSSVENSTDMEDHSSVSGDSRMSSPRSRSLSTSQELVYTTESQGNGLLAPIHMYPGHMMPMPFYPMGFMPMPIPDMSQMSFDPSVIQSSGLPPFGAVSSIPLSPEQQQSLVNHQQNVMMMPFPPMYMIPHPQFDPSNQAPTLVNHLIGMTEAEAIYNIQSENQMYYESLLHAQSQQTSHLNLTENQLNLPTPEMTPDASSENEYEIITAVRQQM